MNNIDKLRFYPTAFCTLPIPYKNASKSFSLSVPKGGKLSLSSPEQVPSGMYGRLALVALTTMALNANEKNIAKYDSIYNLLYSLNGKKPTSKQIISFQSQLINWSTTLITLSHVSKHQKNYANLLLIDKACFSLEKDKTPDSGCVVFTEQGLDFLISNSMPLPIKTINNIKTPFEFDVFVWLAISLFQLKRKEIRCIAWEKLYDQFHISQNKRTEFRKYFCNTLDQVAKKHYPDANYSHDDSAVGGITLRPSRPLVSEKEKTISIFTFQEEA